MTTALLIYASLAPVLCLVGGISIGWRMRGGKPPVASFLPSLLRATQATAEPEKQQAPKPVLRP